MDLFNIVAVDDFNMGAMENKSLNIFNSRLVLASPETATDMDFARIEGVVGHEYFHNWTGDRVTCRDWFQLTLKEGLTVFRDQVTSTMMCYRLDQLVFCYWLEMVWAALPPFVLCVSARCRHLSQVCCIKRYAGHMSLQSNLLLWVSSMMLCM